MMSKVTEDPAVLPESADGCGSSPLAAAASDAGSGAGHLVPGVDYRSAPSHSLRDDIVRYYDECYWDYRSSWSNSENLAIHYGYWGPDTRSHAEALLNLNRVLADIAEVRPDDHVLDAGCGIGGSALWLAQYRGARVTGITLSAEQVRRAAQNAARRELTRRVQFMTGDFCATPFPDASFDVIWGVESVCHALDKGAFVREAQRLLRPGGRLVCADGYAARREYSEAEWRIIRTCLDGWQIPNLATPDEFRSYLESAGLRHIGFRDATAQILPSSRRLYRTALITYPMQKIMGWLKLRTPAQTGNFYTALNQYRIFHDGLGYYGIFSAVK